MAIFDKHPRNQRMCSVSQFTCLPLGKFGSCFGYHFIELTCLIIGGYLLIPALIFEFMKPFTQASKILRGKITNADFYSFYFAHNITY